ncbi:MAG: adenylate/guanylate cyclase domain-containing protein [Pseudomonadota bacterium]
MKLSRPGTVAVRLRPSIVMLFILMMLPVFSAAIWVGYVSNDRMARDTAEKTVERSRLETIGQTEALLYPIASLVRVSAEVAAEQPDFYRSEKAVPAMLAVLGHSANISSVYVGFADGSYRMALRVPKGLRIQNTVPPEATKFSSRWLDRRAPKPQDIYTFLDGGRRAVGRLNAPALYDPRVRPWFTDAVAKKDLVISNPYIYATTGLPGITVAMPFYSNGQFAGVLAIDILLDSLSQYLKTRPVSAHSTSFIVDSDGLVVVHPDNEQALKREAGGSLTRTRLTELTDPVPAMAFAVRAEKKENHFTFIYGGLEYVAMFSPFPPAFGKQWEVVILAPLEDFLGEWRNNNNKLLVFGLVAIALQVLLIYALSRRIAMPLEQLERQVAEVQNFTAHGGVTIRSPIREISSLATAVDKLQGAIGAFSSFVPRDLVRQLINSGQQLELGGRSQFLTILFTDLESFSTWAEATPAQELLVRISAYFEVVTRATNQEFGTLDKFIGDGVMAFWGAPAPLADHAYHACVAAVRVQRGMEELNARWAAQGMPPLNVRVGIHSDAVLVGNMGSAERMSYTVMGDGVNLAARLEGTNKEFGTRICLSHAVYREAGERLWLRRMGMVTVKGRRADLQVYELLGIKGGDPALEASPDTIRLCEMTNLAYEAFAADQWDEAIRLFRAVAEAFPQDRLAKIMLERCEVAQGSFKSRLPRAEPEIGGADDFLVRD